MEDLLARLEVESDKTAHKIVSLLESSYFPSAGDDSTRVQRSVIVVTPRMHCLSSQSHATVSKTLVPRFLHRKTYSNLATETD